MIKRLVLAFMMAYTAGVLAGETRYEFYSDGCFDVGYDSAVVGWAMAWGCGTTTDYYVCDDMDEGEFTLWEREFKRVFAIHTGRNVQLPPISCD